MNFKLTVIIVLILAYFFPAISSKGKSIHKYFDIRINTKFGAKYGIINEKGKVLIEPKFDNNLYYNESADVFATSLNDKEVYVDTEGKILFERDKFAKVMDFSEGLAAVNVGGKWITRSRTKPVADVDIGFEGGKWGFIDRTGKIVIPVEFDGVNKFSEGLAYVVKDKKGFLIDKNGNYFTKNLKGKCGEFKNGLAVYNIDGKMGYINKKGKIVIKPQFNLAYPFKNSLAIVRIDITKENIFKSKYALIDTDGKFVVKLKYDEIRPFSDGFANIRMDNKWGYIDKKGNEVIKPQFLYYNDFHEGFAKIDVGKYSGFIDKKGKIVFNKKFDAAGYFSEGLAPVQIGKNWGFINTKGELAINAIYANAASFEGGLASVWLDENGKEAYIDKHGNIVFKPD